jgi:hypothetical protein
MPRKSNPQTRLLREAALRLQDGLSSYHNQEKQGDSAGGYSRIKTERGIANQNASRLRFAPFLTCAILAMVKAHEICGTRINCVQARGVP